MWQDILKKTKTYAGTFIQLENEWNGDKLWNWLGNLTLNELHEAQDITEEEYDEIHNSFSDIEDHFYNDYNAFINTLEGQIDRIHRKKQDEQHRAWVKANPEKAKERDKKNEESRLRNQKANEESNAREEARNRKIWESHARAKTAKRKPPKRKGQRRRR